MSGLTPPEGFVTTWARLRALQAFLASEDAARLTAAEVEERIETEGGPLLRQFLQDALDLRARRQGIASGTGEASHLSGGDEENADG
ncbi:MAG: hypothetical protein ACREEW_18095 [Caulobacteraceae bacterium]